MTPFEPTMGSGQRRHWAEVAIDAALLLVAAGAATLLIATAPVGPMPSVTAKPSTAQLAAAPAPLGANQSEVR